jgi:DNA modification methylase
LVAEQFNRDWIGIELSSEFARLAKERIEGARADPAKKIRGIETREAA